MADTADTANVIVQPPIAWALAVLAGLALKWLMPLSFLPTAVPTGWLGTIVFALALALVAWAISTMTRAGSNVPTSLLIVNQLGRKRRQSIDLTSRPTVFDRYVAAFHETAFAQTLAECDR